MITRQINKKNGKVIIKGFPLSVNGIMNQCGIFKGVYVDYVYTKKITSIVPLTINYDFQKIYGEAFIYRSQGELYCDLSMDKDFTYGCVGFSLKKTGPKYQLMEVSIITSGPVKIMDLIKTVETEE